MATSRPNPSTQAEAPGAPGLAARLAERGQAVVIERCETEAYIEESPAVVANHWLNSGLKGRARGVDSVARH